MWYVYALYNPSVEKIYIGETSDVSRRLAEHNQKRGNHFTAKVSGAWQVIYEEKLANRKEALIREKQLKGHKGREFIKQFIRVEDCAPR